MCEKGLLLRSSSSVEFGLDFFFPDSASQRAGGEKGKSGFHWGMEEVGVEGMRAESLKNERLVEEYSKVSE